MRQILGLGDLSSLPVDKLDATQTGYSTIRHGIAHAEAVRSAQPLVLTTIQRRCSDGALRTLVTVVDVFHGPQGAPTQLLGQIIDITDDVGDGVQLAQQTLIGLISYGSSLVVLLCGEFDLGNRQHLADAMDTVVRRGEQRVYFDASQLRFCDAHGIGLLAQTALQLARAGRHAALLHCSEILRRMLSLTSRPDELADITIRNVPAPADDD